MAKDSGYEKPSAPSDLVMPSPVAIPQAGAPTAAPGAKTRGSEGQLVVGPPLALQQFLYILVRDHLPFGVVEEILLHHVENTKGETVSFSEPRMAAYAASLAARLK